MSAVVGIDLGTTNTVVAHVEGGRAQALGDENGERILPSVVSFHPSGQVIVGKQAKERRRIDASNTIFSIKRLIGRAWESDDVKRAKSRFPFELREGPGHAVLVVARGETYTLSEISAYVLRKAKAVAEAALGQPVERAVITVPANFNDLQRAATKVAGRVAGLEVLRILNEPTAAALAYGYGKSNAERIAIYDFGGGTFDVTLLDLSGNVFEVLATGGDTFLGGDDIDLALTERICDAFLKQHRYDPRSDPQAFERVRASAEELKIALSLSDRAEVSLEEVAFGPGGQELSMKYTMTRKEFDGLVRPLVEKTFDVCRDALQTARAQAKDFDQIILVGGTTRIPLVRQRVAEFFGRDPLGHVSPDEVVAIGAAIQGMALTAHERKRAAAGGAEGDRPKTLGGLGQAAQRAQTDAGLAPVNAPRKTDPGLARRTDPAIKQGMIASPGAATERAPNTADFDKPAARQPSVPDVKVVKPPPAPPPRKAFPSDAATKLSLAEEATKARKSFTEDSVADALLPLIGSPTRTLGNEPNLIEDEVTRVHDVREDPTLKREVVPEVQAAPPPPPAPAPAKVPTATVQLTSPLAAPPAQHIPQTPPPAPVVPSAPAFVPPVAAAPAAQPRGPGATQVLGSMPQQAPQAPPGGMKIPQMGTVQMTEVRQPAAPLLVDVTPLSLIVETVGGYCDVVIARNTPIPCDRTRSFVTVKNHQRSVIVRVAQGENASFRDNTQLGQVELTGLREAPRGEVVIEVTFEIDVNGMLQVRARDTGTGREARADLRLKGLDGPSPESLMMRQARQQIV